jgi:hypothetical protein
MKIVKNEFKFLDAVPRVLQPIDSNLRIKIEEYKMSAEGVMSGGQAEIHKGENARMSSFVGAIAIADLVKTTLGPKGKKRTIGIN